MIGSSRGLFSRFVGDLLWSGGVLLLAADLALAFRAGRVPTATVLGADALIITGGLVARLVSAMNRAEAPTFALAVIAAVCLGAAGLGDRPGHPSRT